MPIPTRISHTLAQRAWLRKSLRWIAIVAAALLVLAFISWLALPHFVKKIAVEQIDQQLGRKAEIGDVSFNPFILKLTISDFTLFEPDRTTPAVTVKTLIVNASSTSLVRRALVLDAGQVIAPKVHLIRTSADGIGRYNFSDIIDRILAKPKNDNPTPPFLLANLQLQNGEIHFEDKVTNKQIDITALTLGAPVISNLPSRIDTYVQPYASAVINGAKFELKGRSKPFADNLETALAIDLEQLDLPGYVPFSPVALPVKLRSGKLSTQLDLRFSRAKEVPEILLSGDVRLDNLNLADNRDAPLLTSRSVQAKIKQINLLGGSSVIDALTIDTPEVWAGFDQQNVLNWLRLGAAPAAKPVATAPSPAAPKAAAPTLLLTQLTVRNGTVNWYDAYNASPRLDTQLTHLDIDAQRLSTAAGAAPAAIKLSAAEAGGGNLKVNAQVAPATAVVDADVSLDGLGLGRYQPYLNKVLTAGMDGKLSLHAKIGVAGSQLKLSGLNLNLDDLKLTGKAKADGAVTVKSIALSNGAADTGARQFHADALRINGLNADVKRDTHGKLNLQQFLVQSAPPTRPAATRASASVKTTPQASAKAPAEWQASLGEFAISDSTIAYQDQSVIPALSVRAESLKATVNNLSTALDQPLKVALEATFNKNGKLTIAGGAAPQFKTVGLDVNADRISIAPFQPYFSDYVNIVLRRGLFSAKGKLTVAPPMKGQTLGIAYAGAVHLTDFDLQDKTLNTDFLRWRALDLTGIDARIGKGTPQIGIGKIALNTFYARAILSPEGQLNLKNIMVSKDAPPAAAGAKMGPATGAATEQPKTKGKETVSAAPVTAAAPDPNAPIIHVGQTVLSEGNINFTDNFVKPNYTANMTGMNGSIGSIASDKPQPAAIELKGKIDNDAPLAISGTLNPLFKPMFLDIKASTNGVELTRMTPYAAKYAGYPIIKGKLSMDVSYKIENEQLVAQNDVRIDQLTFGDRVDSPDATKLPVMLAVALLKDRNGQINLNLPVSGSLNDPQFSVGGIIGRIIVNLIVKVVTSPFALLNSVFGGGGEQELGYVEFAPGAATLTSATEKKLDTLSKALTDRPALKLEVIGRVDPAADTNGLRRAALDDKIRQLKQSDTKSQEPVNINDADRAKYLEAAYKDEKFAKPKNAIGFAKSLPPDEMERLILENTKVAPEDLRELALHRADAVGKYLQENDKIPRDRIYLVAPKLTAEGIQDKGAPTRVDFSLK
ncbi:MAG: putative exported protein [Herbaspirillum sp.]|nr:putative exported protein [Herbaspirillum sp.]